jgi:hypothetical protein
VLQVKRKNLWSISGLIFLAMLILICVASRNSEQDAAIETLSQAEKVPGVWKMTDVYEIRVREHLGNCWASQFDGFDIALAEDGMTTLVGPVADQAALHGLLIKVCDPGLILLSVHRVRI